MGGLGSPLALRQALHSGVTRLRIGESLQFGCGWVGVCVCGGGGV